MQAVTRVNTEQASKSNGAGHLPVFLDFRVPPRVQAPAVIDFGQVPQNQPASQNLEVTNGGDVTLWTTGGIAPLNYSLSAGPGFSAPAGSFTEAPGGSGNMHVIDMDTSIVGPMNGTLTIANNAPGSPSLVVSLIGEVTSAACMGADANCDGQVNLDDVGPLTDVLLGLAAPCNPCAADADTSGTRDAADVPAFLSSLLP